MTRNPLIVVVPFALALALVCIDAAHRRSASESAWAAQRRIAAATGLTDPFLSSGSRWLRHPSLAEPGAASADAPDGLDVDPGGLAIRSPRDIPDRALVVRP